MRLMHLQENRHHQQRLKIILKSSKQHSSLFSLFVTKSKTILYKILILFNYVIKLMINEKLSRI